MDLAPTGETRQEPAHVVIVGAGPAGLLSAINFLRRRKENSDDHQYKVTLIDTSQDYGALSSTELRKHRSWMIGLYAHGLKAIREIPNLYEEYVSKVAVKLESRLLYVGGRKLKFSTTDTGEGYVVDRNFIVAALARYLNFHFADNGALQTMYNNKVLYVDGENKRLLVRDSKDKLSGESYVSYDLLVGCDGIRSCVRDVLVKEHRDFEVEVGDIFCKFKLVHVQRPKSIEAGSTHSLVNCLPNMNAIVAPETGDKVCIGFFYFLNKPSEEALNSVDQKVISAYIKEKLTCFPVEDYDDFAAQWVGQEWNATGQVHCNCYHSSEHRILIMGDAAHATSPSIGQGMNMALADASVLNRLLDANGDDIVQVLPAFSKERVKEGNALTYLSFYQYSMSSSQALWLTLKSAVRMILHKRFPTIIIDSPLAMIRKGTKLSVAYDTSVKIGTIQAVRRVNDRVRREYFERTTGMVTEDQRQSSWGRLFAVVVAAAGAAFIATTRTHKQ